MGRSRATAKQAGARFERSQADYWAEHVDDRIDRRVKTGAADKGDLGGIRLPDSARAVAELKDYGGRLEPSTWLHEAHTEANNDGAEIGFVIAKRRGIANPGRQYVLMEVDDLIRLLTGKRP